VALSAGSVAAGRAAPPLVIKGTINVGDVLVRSGRIEAMGTVEAPSGARIIDASGDLVTPGLVNTHHHLFQRVTRGEAVGCDLLGWLRHLLPLWSRLSVPDMAAAARLSLVELALGGVTTTVDHHFVVPGGDTSIFTALAATSRELGLRLILCRGAIDLGEQQAGIVPDSLVEDADEVMASVAGLAASLELRSAEGSGSLVSLAIAPSSLFAVTDRLLSAAAATAARLDLGLHIHLSESPAEAAYCLQRFGRRPVELLEDLGWLERPLWVAHGIHLDQTSINRLGAHGVGIAHCPAANARLASGIAPVDRLEAAGCPVGLGVDGAAANDAGSMVAQMRLSLYLARLREGRADACLPQDVLRRATAGGAACVGRPDLGRLEVGATADLAVWALGGVADFADPVDALVLGPEPRARFVTVAGNLVVVDGEVPGVDVAEMRADVLQRARRIRLG